MVQLIHKSKWPKCTDCIIFSHCFWLLLYIFYKFTCDEIHPFLSCQPCWKGIPPLLKDWQNFGRCDETLENFKKWQINSILLRIGGSFSSFVDVWTPTAGTILCYAQGPRNEHDRFAIACFWEDKSNSGADGEDKWRNFRVHDETLQFTPFIAF